MLLHGLYNDLDYLDEDIDSGNLSELVETAVASLQSDHRQQHNYYPTHFFPGFSPTHNGGPYQNSVSLIFMTMISLNYIASEIIESYKEISGKYH